jgi:hypothetical protein
MHGILEADHPHTAREVFYRLVAAGALKNKQSQYSAMCHILTEARERGDIDWDWIEDHMREQHGLSGEGDWESAEEYIASLLEDIRSEDSVVLNRWTDQPRRVIVILEKDAALNTVEALCNEWMVRLFVLRGFSSATYSHDIARVFQRLKRLGKQIHVLYFGDHDPSGRAIEAATRETVWRYSGGVKFEWKRLGVLKQDGKKLKLIPNPEKQRDARTPGFLAEYGSGCYELEAVPAAEIRKRLDAAIRGLIDQDLWDAVDDREEEENKIMESFNERVNELLADFKAGEDER